MEARTGGFEKGERLGTTVSWAMSEEEDERAVVLPITDSLDLHSFRPQEVADLVRDYLDAARERGLKRLRIVHGRGTGVQRRIVRSVLERDPRVRAFGDAPPEAGGWGATWLEME